MGNVIKLAGFCLKASSGNSGEKWPLGFQRLPCISGQPTPRARGSEGRAGGAEPVRHTPGGGFLQVGRCLLPLGPASLRPGKVSFLAGIQTKRLSQLCGSIAYSDFFNFYLMSFSIPGSHSKLPHYNLRLLAGTVSQTLLGFLGFDDLEGFEEHWSRVP